jgi:hypothetical protein
MSTSPTAALDTFIGSTASRAFFPLVDRLIERTAKAHYVFQDIELFATLLLENPAERTRVYWREMLSRAHLAAAISLRRNKAWLDGAASAAHNHNPLALAACLRGFIEAAADTHDALSQVPLTIATTSSDIFRALSGKSDIFVVSQELEDKLIHFAYARKVRGKENIDAKYQAKSAAEYIAEFKWFNAPAVVDLYSQLCEYAHAAAPSVQMFLDQIDEATVSTLSHKKEANLDLPRDLPSIMERVAILAFSPSLITLGTLNYFPLPTLHTPEATPQVCSGMNLWAKVEHAFRTSRPAAAAAPPN